MTEWTITEWTITVAIAVVAIIAIAFPARVSVRSGSRLLTHVREFLVHYFSPMVLRDRSPALRVMRFAERREVQLAPLTRVSVSHPKRLSKGFSSKILVLLYNPAVRAAALREILREFANQDYLEKQWKAMLPPDELITIRLTSPSIKFTSPVKFNSNTKRVSTRFIAMPNDNSAHGLHSVRVDIANAESQEEYFSGTFQVMVADFVFDHVSQPFFSGATAIVLACASVTTFVLTFFQQIDMTTGLASGTTAAVASGAIYGGFLLRFRRSTSKDLVP